MRTCPAGHESASEDFCDVCGIRIAAEPLPHGDPTPGPAGQGNAAPPAAPSGDPCPRCGTARAGQFCEACGYSFAGTRPATAALSVPVAPHAPLASSAPLAPSDPPAPPAATTASAEPAAVTPPATGDSWTAVVTADRAYYESVLAAGGPDAAGIEFPGYCPQRRFSLSGTQVRVGRRSVSRGIQPEIDLTGPPADPGVSRLHLVLIPAPDGTWSAVDPGSANGVLVNGTPIAPGEAIPLHDGDRILLGAWTVLTIVSGAPPRP